MNVTDIINSTSKSQLKRIIKNQDKKQSISPLEIQNIGTDKRSNVSDSNYEAKLAKLQNDNDNEKYEADQVKTTLTTPQLISHLKSAYANNQMLRMKYAEDAEKFLQSELNLHDSIQDLRQNVVNSDFFGALLQFKAISTFLSILNHENNDISIACIELLSEITDEDVAESENKNFESVINEITALEVHKSIFQSLLKFDLTNDEESKGAYFAFSFFENIFDLKPELVNDSKFSFPIIDFIFKNLKQKSVFDSNRLFMVEIFCILTQNDDNKEYCAKKKYTYILLIRIAQYKKKNPDSVEEIEFLEGLFSAMCSLIISDSNRKLFIDQEGIQLMVLLLKSAKKSSLGALKLLSFVLSGVEDNQCVEIFVNVTGIRYFFPYFVKNPKNLSKSIPLDEYEGWISSIAVSLVENSDGNIFQRISSKFCEDNFHKFERLLELFKKYFNLEKNQPPVNSNLDSFTRDIHYLDQLENGLETLQFLARTIWCLIYTTRLINDASTKLFKMQNLMLKDVYYVVKDYIDNVRKSSISQENYKFYKETLKLFGKNISN